MSRSFLSRLTLGARLLPLGRDIQRGLGREGPAARRSLQLAQGCALPLPSAAASFFCPSLAAVRRGGQVDDSPPRTGTSTTSASAAATLAWAPLGPGWSTEGPSPPPEVTTTGAYGQKHKFSWRPAPAPLAKTHLGRADVDGAGNHLPLRVALDPLPRLLVRHGLLDEVRPGGSTRSDRLTEQGAPVQPRIVHRVDHRRPRDTAQLALVVDNSPIEPRASMPADCPIHDHSLQKIQVFPPAEAPGAYRTNRQSCCRRTTRCRPSAPPGCRPRWRSPAPATGAHWRTAGADGRRPLAHRRTRPQEVAHVDVAPVHRLKALGVNPNHILVVYEGLTMGRRRQPTGQNGTGYSLAAGALVLAFCLPEE